ncbi:hypothetical protein SDC9_154275 [bioreactor metagenome]|uniref:Uncharacterized protein n=1 Tax=bioreactor metagenome TaxID=1076179 RepID=A0A645F001_9ZZZZ
MFMILEINNVGIDQNSDDVPVLMSEDGFKVPDSPFFPGQSEQFLPVSRPDIGFLNIRAF